MEADAENLPFANGAFDAVVSTFGVMFTPDQDEAMRKAMMPVYKDVAARVGQPLIDEFLKETGRGPMNLIPLVSHTSAKLAFSASNP